MDQEQVKAILAGIAIAAVEDAIDGTPNRWPEVEAALDSLYDGSFITERVADYIDRHPIKDAYEQAVVVGHAKILTAQLPPKTE